MAKIRSGVLGNTRGKVGGVVASQWKNKNYLREYVKPANPRTLAQQAQRSKMSLAVSFCKPLVGQIFNGYTDRFLKGMSGFNAFIKDNIHLFVEGMSFGQIKLTVGKLFPAPISVSTYNSETGSFITQWNLNMGNNGLLTDEVNMCVYDVLNDNWFIAVGQAVREDQELIIDIGPGLHNDDLRVWLFAAQKSGEIVKLISDAGYNVVDPG